MKAKILPLLGIAFVVAIVSTGIFYGLIVSKLGGGSNERSIVVAARKLERGAVLKESDVKLVKWKGSNPPEGAVDDVKKAAGATVMDAVAADAPITQKLLLGAGAPVSSSGGVPSGMRAVSVHVADSSGIVSLLGPGQRVDVQVVRSSEGRGVSEPELRTIVQDLEVLSVLPADPQQSRNGAPVVTLLATPPEVDMLGLADSGARVRLALRNPVDKQKNSLPSMVLNALFHYMPPEKAANGVIRASLSNRPAANNQPAAIQPARSKPAPGGPATGDQTNRQIFLRVRIAEAGAAALEELGAHLLMPRRPDYLQVLAFGRDWDFEDAMRRLQGRKEIEVLSASDLVAGNDREVAVEAEASWPAGKADSGSQPAASQASRKCGIRIQFRPSFGSGVVRMRVQPEIASPEGDGVSTRGIDTEVELADGQSFLVSGLTAPGEASSWSRIFPGHVIDPAKHEVVALITPQMVRPNHTGRSTAAMLTKP